MSAPEPVDGAEPLEELCREGLPASAGPLSPGPALVRVKRDAYVVFLSDSDPALGDAQRGFAESCGFPLRKAGVPGHTPLACRLELFEEMIEEARPAGAGGDPGLAECDKISK